MTSFNLSRWAVGHRALVLFLILATSVAGLTAFLKLGRAEDPNFTIKVGIVTAVWPGATAREMQDQVADPIEKKLQALPYFEKVDDLREAGLRGHAGHLPGQHAAGLVPSLFYQMRKKIDDVRPTCRPASRPLPSTTNTATSIPSSTC